MALVTLKVKLGFVPVMVQRTRIRSRNGVGTVIVSEPTVERVVKAAVWVQVLPPSVLYSTTTDRLGVVPETALTSRTSFSGWSINPIPLKFCEPLAVRAADPTMIS